MSSRLETLEREAGKVTAVFGQHDEKTIAQLRHVATRAAYAALMADGHLGYMMPIGGVAAYRNQVSVPGVGYDIACGNAAIKTDRFITDYTRRELELLADEIAGSISFGVGRSNNADDAPVDHELFDSPAWTLLPAEAKRDQLRKKARAQLGTVGSGNHYVDLFADREDGRIWVGVHFGSRGLGHTIASGFLALAANVKWGERAKESEAILDLDTPVGQDYWALMTLAGDYAYAGREWVARKVVDIIGARELELVHNHHNYSWVEEHFGEKLIVVRKGATPAFPGQKGFIGGSMGDDAVIVQGSHGDPEQENALYSTVHGAGRVMSRTQARGKTKGWGPRARIVSPGLISQEMMDEWIGQRGVILRGGGLDEAPQAYRRLPEVLASQGGTVELLHTLSPIIVVMAGGHELDPYKD
ncbi:MAG TPA: RtcB family protein [Gemmatimonadaceae bacterium]|nr:RtcB family protein [Gemmatimonadaceae bacterium]